MVTKAKANVPERAAHPLAAELAKGVKLLDSGKPADAIKHLEPLATDAAADVAFRRCVESYISLAKAKLHPAKVPVATLEDEIQSLLNQRDHGAALKAIDKAIKAQPKKGLFHYLAATAHAQAGKAEPAAECMRQAMALDPSTVFLFRLEPDFEVLRRSPLFAFTENI